MSKAKRAFIICRLKTRAIRNTIMDQPPIQRRDPFSKGKGRASKQSGSRPAKEGATRAQQDYTGDLKEAQNEKGRIGCPLATDPALSSKQNNRYLPEPTSAGNKPARALSCSAVVRFPEGCGTFWPFTATPSYLRASMILSSAAFIEIPLSQLMAAVPLFTATVPLKKRIQDTVINSLMQPYLDIFLATH